jgi:hypothetical protein
MLIFSEEINKNKDEKDFKYIFLSNNTHFS